MEENEKDLERKKYAKKLLKIGDSYYISVPNVIVRTFKLNLFDYSLSIEQEGKVIKFVRESIIKNTDNS